MERSYEHDTDEALINDWHTAGLSCNHTIRSHRAPRSRARGAIVASALVVTTGVSMLFIGPLSSPQSLSTLHSIDSYAIISPDNDALADMAAQERMLEDYHKRERYLEEISRKSRNKEIVRVTSIYRQRTKPIPPRVKFTHPVPNSHITSCYGMRNGRMHVGIDFAAPTGTPIRAITAGTVVQAGRKFRDLGYTVTIKHANGVMTMYAHASKVLVRSGQHVRTGDVVALIGSTGHSTGPHLHLNVAKTTSLSAFFERTVNPAPWLRANGVRLNRC